MTEEEVNQFEKTQSQLNGLHIEIGLLSKKNPNDAVNKFKLKFINKTIEESNELLGEEYKPYQEFEKFEEEDMPTTSDVTMMLEQYLNCLEKLRSDNLEYGTGSYYWVIDGEISDIKTANPFKFKR
ncbi:MAG: hypothetical protein PHY68_10940 [Proteiniphilum sp.]|jgi:hypothetical protein|nr:hypothetical protein [Synergistaceae bacterium]MDD2796959.1 hypothetical protein [Candidatus Paceibacterota bacterium]MDD3333860.1 hypothetical protein [Proteiniphilum sp.]MDD5620945.1 hypothetical protein [Proteiniphilum sp.]MDY0183808.1 hypothetical protein [Proteiniphilum sp.]